MYRNKSSEFFKELKEWSERKQQLIQHYLDGASRILKTVYYVDGFAGAGLYENRQESPKPGTPVRAAELASLYEKRSYNFELRCITVEEDFENYTALQKATAKYGHLVHNLHGTFSEHLATILSLTQDNPVVCLLDPFGVKGIELDAIRQFASRPGKTDIWIRFDVKYAMRLWGRLRSNNPDDPAHRNLLKRVYGIQDEDLLYQAIDGPNPQTRRCNALNLYKQQLSKTLLGPASGKVYVESYRIGSLAQEEKYHLVFGCRHPKALALASDIVCGIEETYQRQAERYRLAQTGQISMFETFLSDEQLTKYKVDDVEQDIIRLCQGRTLTVGGVYQLLLANNWFGMITQTHVRKALTNLEGKGCLLKTGRLSDDSTQVTFVP